MASIKDNVETLETLYPECIEFANQQLKIFWLPDEIKVEKDVNDILTNMTEAERHGVTTVLKLFSLYELRAGTDWWLGSYMKRFPRPEFHRMASVFGMFELAVHKPFYTKLNELLHLDNDEFYLSYHTNDILDARMKSIGATIDSESDLFALAGFSFIEGAVLYSSFAFLKHFQSVGKNKLMNVVRGINFSVRDENLHAEAAAWTFRQFVKENPVWLEIPELENAVKGLAEQVYSHECEIIKEIFSKGKIEGITEHQMVNFTQSRINLCLENLGYGKMFHVEYNPIATWFYEGTTGFQFNDQFSGVGNSYHRNWAETEFKWG